MGYDEYYFVAGGKNLAINLHINKIGGETLLDESYIAMTLGDYSIAIQVARRGRARNSSTTAFSFGRRETWTSPNVAALPELRT